MLFTLKANASGGSGVPRNWNFTWNNLPPGCVPRFNATETCAANTSGRWNVSVTVHDVMTGQTHRSTNASVLVNPTLSIVQVTSSAGLNVTVNYSLSLSVVVTGGTLPYSYTYTGLPTGCATSNNSSLPCTPKATGTFHFAVTVSDSVGGSNSSTGTLTVHPKNATPSFTTTKPKPLSAVTWAAIGAILILGAAISAALFYKARRDERATFGPGPVSSWPPPAPGGGTPPPSTPPGSGHSPDEIGPPLVPP